MGTESLRSDTSLLAKVECRDHGSRVPRLMPNTNISIYRFDALTENIIEFIRQGATVDQILEKFQDRVSEVKRCLKELEQFKIIELCEEAVSEESKEKHTQEVDPTALEDERRMSPTVASEIVCRSIKTGSLRDINVVDLIDDAAAKQFTGRLSLAQEGDTVSFYFIDGSAMGVKSSASRHEQGGLLRDEGLIDDAMSQRYRAEISKNKKTIEALRLAGVTDYAAMAKLIVGWGKAVFREVKNWTEGSYEIEENASFPSDIARCRLRLETTDTETWRKRGLAEDQEAFFFKIEKYYLVARGQAQSAIDNMGFNPAEMRFVKGVLESAPIQLRRALVLSPFSKSKAKKLLIFLIKRRVFELLETNPEGDAPMSLDDIESFAVIICTRNYFDALGVHAVSSEKDIKERYEKQIRKFDPQLYKQANESHLKAIEHIRASIQKAYAVLSDQTSRREYRAKIYTPYQLDIFFDLQMEKAYAAIGLRNDAKGALPLVLSALDIKPNHIDAKKMASSLQRSLEHSNETSRFSLSIAD